MNRLMMLPALLALVLGAACAGDDPANGPHAAGSAPAAAVEAPASADTAPATDTPASPGAPAPEVASGAAPAAEPEPAVEAAPAPPADPVQEVAVSVGPDGFEPRRLTLEPGIPARLVFTRTTDQTCATEVVVPDFDVGPVPLPLDTPVVVEFTPAERGEFAFTCGMEMYRGTLVVGS